MTENRLSFSTDDYDDEEPRTEPITFEVDGETFVCAVEPPGVVLFEHYAAAATGLLSVYADKCLRFFELVMEPDEHERFLKFIHDPARKVNTKLLGAIYNGLMIEFDRVRPTNPPEDSSGGSSRTAATSTGSSSSGGSRRKAGA